MGKVVRSGAQVSCRFCGKSGNFRPPNSCPEGWRVGRKAEGDSFFDCRCRDDGATAGPTPLAIVGLPEEMAASLARTEPAESAASEAVEAAHDFDAISRIEDPVVRSYALQARMARYRGEMAD